MKKFALYFFILCIIYCCVYEYFNICKFQSKDEQLFDILAPKLILYDAKENGKEVNLAKICKLPLYIPSPALRHCKKFITYGKKSFYDYESYITSYIGLPVINYSNSSTETKQFFYDLYNSRKNNEKVFLKIDVKNVDKTFITKILEFRDIIDGIIIVMNIEPSTQISKYSDILKEINTQYLLMARNTDFMRENKPTKQINSKYYKGEINSSILLLSYVNKRLVNSYSISLIQNTDFYYTKDKVRYHRPVTKIPKSEIKSIITITEILKNKLTKVE